MFSAPQPVLAPVQFAPAYPRKSSRPFHQYPATVVSLPGVATQTLTTVPL
ncbi:hypothetical protein [Yinghuangia soli]|uniref:Uncharacterized protein n=1 Tax=Yinghuangia soli TaxID=2908204 RepID=A0AA41U4I7_9ACTN|nr:hypothetical protein [Yinghuangia soli]MCF2530852.1 hypothetical protein [Yinghuangia soli]